LGKKNRRIRDAAASGVSGWVGATGTGGASPDRKAVRQKQKNQRNSGHKRQMQSGVGQNEQRDSAQRITNHRQTIIARFSHGT